MTSNLTALRLLRAYRDLAAAGYPGGPGAFAELADLAERNLANVSPEEWMPATVVLNAFHDLSQKQESPGAGPPLPPAFHEAVMTTLEFLVEGGEAARCLELSERLVRTYPKGERLMPIKS